MIAIYRICAGDRGPGNPGEEGRGGSVWMKSGNGSHMMGNVWRESVWREAQRREEGTGGRET